MLKPTIFFLFFLFVIVRLPAQSFSFKNYTTHEGLVQTDITAITQDKKGNIWIGTNGGISIFDGKAFTNYDEHDVLQSLRINALLCDSGGTMWVATGNGLLKYDNSFSTFFKTAEPRSAINCLSTNLHNQLFFVCNNTAYIVKGTSVEKYDISKNIDGNIALLSYDRDDNLWIVTNDLGVYKKTGNRLIQIHTPFSVAEKKQGLGFLQILGKQGPTPYFVTNYGSFYVKNDSLQYFSEQYPQFASAKVGHATYVLQQNDSTIWAGGTVGLSKISGNTTTRYVKENGFCDNSVSCIFTDREQNVWIGCTYNGVYKLSNEALFHIKPSDVSFDLRHVSSISPINFNETLFGTWGKGLFLRNGDSLSRINFPSPAVRYITCLFGFGDKTYIGWFGKGLWQMDNATHKISEVATFAKGEVVDMIDKAAGYFVISTLGKTCFITDHNFNLKASIHLGDETAISVVKDKIYQMNSAGQVDLLDYNLQVVKKNIFPGITSQITELTCYRDNFLVGTFGQGLFVYNQWGKLLKRLDRNSGLNTNLVTSLLVDGAHLFIGSNLGLIRADLPDLENIKIFKENEGMFNWECRRNGLKKTGNGSLVIATTNGPYLYYPDKDLAGQNVSGVLSVADFSYGAHTKTHTLFSPIDLNFQVAELIDYKERQLAITLKGVSQRNPDDIVYHYQLQGYDPMWVSTANPVIKYDDLEPGDYKLRAYMTIGDFSSKLISVKFSVDTPLSGKLWFQVLLILFLSGLCWLLLTVGNRIYQRYIQSKMVNRLEADIAVKQQLTMGSLLVGQQQYKQLSSFLNTEKSEKDVEKLASFFFNDTSNRISLLWKNNDVPLSEVHAYFDKLIACYGPGATIYHKLPAGDYKVAVTVAFYLLQIFSLYLVTNLHQNGAAVFSLDSESKANGQLLLRFYTVSHLPSCEKHSAYDFFKGALAAQKPDGVTIDVIENLELGNMLIAEINLQSEKQL